MFIEHRGGLGKHVPYNVQAFSEAGGSIQHRRSVAHAAMCAGFSDLQLKQMEFQFNEAKVERTHMETQDELVAALNDGPHAYKLQPVAVRHVDDLSVARQLVDAPIQALRNGLTSFGVDFGAEASHAELMELIVQEKLTRRVCCQHPAEWDPLIDPCRDDPLAEDPPEDEWQSELAAEQARARAKEKEKTRARAKHVCPRPIRSCPVVPDRSGAQCAVCVFVCVVCS